MKKKFFAIATIALLSVMCLSVFAACTTDTDVDGKTFVYDSVEIEPNEEAKKMAADMGMDLDEFTDYTMSLYEEMFSSEELAFKDGKFTQKAAGMTSPAVDYEQDGSKIMIDGVETLTVSGSKLITEYTAEGFTVKVTFKQK